VPHYPESDAKHYLWTNCASLRIISWTHKSDHSIQTPRLNTGFSFTCSYYLPNLNNWLTTYNVGCSVVFIIIIIILSYCVDADNCHRYLQPKMNLKLPERSERR